MHDDDLRVIALDIIPKLAENVCKHSSELNAVYLEIQRYHNSVNKSSELELLKDFLYIVKSNWESFVILGFFLRSLGGIKIEINSLKFESDSLIEQLVKIFEQD